MTRGRPDEIAQLPNQPAERRCTHEQKVGVFDVGLAENWQF
jgi:hypothetical protein